MAMSDPKFESWGVDESPITIDYSLVVIEEIRFEVAQGLQRFSRGGLEVGGVLYGTRDGRKVRVQAMRPIECEHKQGPSFLLSDPDRATLEAQLREQDPGLEGLICVGWFVSHTRGEIALTATDQEVFSTFFNNPWQVTLVVRPGRSGSMRAAFFVWENDGTVQADRSYKEFNFPDRLAGVFDRPRGERAERSGGFRSAGAPIPIPTRHDAAARPPQQMAPQQQTPVFGASSYVPAQPERGKWPWIVLVVVVLLVAAAVVGMRYYVGPSQPEPVSLVMIEQSGQLQVQWNPLTRSVTRAVRGYLEIKDGNEPITIPLRKQDLETGKYLYVRHSGDVEVRLVMEDADGGLTSEASHFVGRAPESPESDQLKELEAKRDELQAEVDRLQRQNAAQASRIQQLERTMRILQARIINQ